MKLDFENCGKEFEDDDASLLAADPRDSKLKFFQYLRKPETLMVFKAALLAVLSLSKYALESN